VGSSPLARGAQFRIATAASGRDLLSGRVEVDETFVGGHEEGQGGRGLPGKTIVGVAVELEQDRLGLGRVRLRVLPDASSTSLRAFVTATIAPGAAVATDGWPAYISALAGSWTHEPTSIRAAGVHAHELLPAVHQVASLLNRWLLGTHQGGVQPVHLPAYLDEFTFRFDRRRSRARGLLFYQLLVNAVRVEPVTYASLVVSHTPKPEHPKGVSGPHARPSSLQLPPPGRPWRHDQH